MRTPRTLADLSANYPARQTGGAPARNLAIHKTDKLMGLGLVTWSFTNRYLLQLVHMTYPYPLHFEFSTNIRINGGAIGRKRALDTVHRLLQ